MGWFWGFRRHGGDRRPFGVRVALGTALGGLMLVMIPAGAAGTEPTPPAFTVEGTVTWLGGPDSRAVLHVGACLVGEMGPGGEFCPSLRTATVAADGSYALALPYGKPSTWNLFAIIAVGPYPLAAPTSFAMGPVRELTVPRQPDQPVPLTISTRAVGLRVVDFEGAAFPEGTAAVMAIPTSTRWWSVANADAEGNVLLFVDPAVEYNVNAFATNTGWPDPWVSPDGTEFHFSVQGLTVLGADIPEGMTFVVQDPTGTLLRVVDGQGNPFPAGTAGINACDTSGTHDPVCIGTIDTNGDGNVLLALDPTTQWWVYGWVINTGWPDPDFVAEDGTQFHFSEPVILDPGVELEDGTVFVVAQPGTA